MINGLTKNILITSVSKILIVGMGLLTTIIIARTLGPSGKGILAALGAMVGIAMQFGNLGIHGANTYFAAKDKSKTSSLVANSFWFSLVIGVVMILVFYIFVSNHLGSLHQVPFHLALVAVISIPFLLLSYLWQSILVGVDKIKAYNFILILNQFFYLIGAIIILLVLKRGLFPLVTFNTIVSVAIAFVFAIYLSHIRELSFHFNWPLAKKSLVYGFKIYLSCFLAYLVLRSDMIILNYFRGAAEVGLYSVAVNFIDGILLLPSIIALMLFPKATQNLSQSGELVAKTIRISIIIIGFICLGVAILGRPTIDLLFGMSFDKSFIPLLILIPGAFFFALSNIIMSYFTANNRLLPIIYIWFIATAVNLSLNFLFIPKYGAIAAAISSLIAYFLVFLLIVNLFIRESGSKIQNIFPRIIDYLFLLESIKYNVFQHKVC